MGVTTGLSDKLSRDELEAVLAYEVSRIRSWDVALASWTVALTGGAITALDSSGDSGVFKGVIGWLPRRFAGVVASLGAARSGHRTRSRRCALHPQPGVTHSRSRNSTRDPSQITHVSRATAPLWIEFPASVLGDSSSGATRRLAKELLLDERIDALRELARVEPADEQ